MDPAYACTIPDFINAIHAFEFADVYDRSALDRSQRQLVILGALIALGADGRLPLHARAAIRAGLTP